MPPAIPRVGLLLTLLSGPGVAQTTQFSGILAGSVFDPVSGGIRMVFGYPGAAHLALPVSSGFDDVSISPDGKSAVALRSSRISGLRQLASGQIESVDFGTAFTSLHVAWSFDSKSAVIWFPNAAGSASYQRWMVNGAPDSTLPLPFSFDSLQAIGLLSGGVKFVAAVRDNDASGIYRVGADGNAVLIAQSNNPSAIAVDPSSPYYYFLNDASVMRQLSDGSQAPEPVITVGLDAVSAPSGIGLLKGHRLALADSASRALLLYSLDSGSLITRIALDTAPDGFLPLGGSDWLVVSHRRQATDSLLLLDSRSESVYFVPADEK